MERIGVPALTCIGSMFTLAVLGGCPSLADPPTGRSACQTRADCDDAEVCINGACEDISTQSGCEAVNGVWQRWGLNPEERCNLRASDAGEPCSDSEDCEGSCTAELGSDIDCSDVSGQCSEFQSVFGCRCFLDSGGAHAICVD